MSGLSVQAVTSRTATILLSPETERFSLGEAVDWTLLKAGGEAVAEGASTRVPVFLDRLDPNTAYVFHALGLEVRFQTLTCAGVIDATDFGVSVDAPDNAEAFARAIDAVQVGGTLTVPAGRYLTGPIFLKSDMTLHLSKGAEIAAISDRQGWPILPAYDHAGRYVGTWEGLPEASFASLITAIDCANVTIIGSGTIDGGGDRGDWWTWPKETRDGARRPRTVFLAHCRDVVLSGVTVRNSPAWTVHPFFCDGLNASAMTIEAPHDSPNTDGFNPESCENLTLRGLRISVGDDCIAVKSGKRSKGAEHHLAPTRNLTIENCRMERGHGAVVMGSEMSGSITDVTIARCEFVDTDRGIRLKTRRGRGGEIARMIVDDIEMNGVLTGFAANAFYFCDPDGKSDAVQSRTLAPVDHTTPAIRGITLQNITAHNVSQAAVALLGLPEAPFTDIRISNFKASFDPDAVAGEPLMACGVKAVRHVAVTADYATLDGSVEIVPTPKDAS